MINIIWHSNDFLKGYGIRSVIPNFVRRKGDTEKLSDWAKLRFLKQILDHMLFPFITFQWFFISLKSPNFFHGLSWSALVWLLLSFLSLSHPCQKCSSYLVASQFLKLHHWSLFLCHDHCVAGKLGGKISKTRVGVRFLGCHLNKHFQKPTQGNEMW